MPSVTLARGSPVLLGKSLSAIVSGDFKGDGKLDLAATGDGKLDLAVANALDGTGSVSILLKQ